MSINDPRSPDDPDSLVIWLAQDIVMSRSQCSSSAALAEMRARSQVQNCTLLDVAVKMVAEARSNHRPAVWCDAPRPRIDRRAKFGRPFGPSRS